MKYKIPPAPKRPYANFQDYVIRSSGWWYKRTTENPYPCRECRGDGTIYDPDDPPCPVEGNKCRRIIKCRHCNATGVGTHKEWIEAYKECIKHWQEVLREHKRTEALRKSGLSKLTEAEVLALGIRLPSK